MGSISGSSSAMVAGRAQPSQIPKESAHAYRAAASAYAATGAENLPLNRPRARALPIVALERGPGIFVWIGSALWHFQSGKDQAASDSAGDRPDKAFASVAFQSPIWPGACPGRWTTFSASLPTSRTSPSSTVRSTFTGKFQYFRMISGSESPDSRPGPRLKSSSSSSGVSPKRVTFSRRVTMRGSSMIGRSKG